AGAIEKPGVLRRIAELQAFAETRKNAKGAGVDRALSVVDFVKHVNRAFHDNDARYYDLPSDEKDIGELLSDRDQLRGFSLPTGESRGSSSGRTFQARGRWPAASERSRNGAGSCCRISESSPPGPSSCSTAPRIRSLANNCRV